MKNTMQGTAKIFFAVVLLLLGGTGSMYRALSGPQQGPPQEVNPAFQIPQVSPKEQEERVQWVRQNGVPISSIDPADEDFSDLMPLAKHIGNSRVVMLGEQSHGDGATFLAKHRLIRFLHKVMGFDVLAWESGLYDCWKMDAALRSSMPIEKATEQGVFHVWAGSGHVKPLFEYVRSTHGTTRPLETAGYDLNFSALGSSASFQTDLLAFVDRVDPNILSAGQRELLKGALERYWKFTALTPEERQSYITGVQEVSATIEKRKADLLRMHSARDVDMYLRSLVNLAISLKISNYSKTKQEKQEKFVPTDLNPRDQRMGENFAWLAKQRYPDRKIIVWAASSHNMRNPSSIKAPFDSYEGLITMGHVAHEALRDEIYSIGFLAYEGAYAPVYRPQPIPLAPADEGSLDWLMNRAGHPYSFIDLKGQSPSHWLRQQLVARPLGYGPNLADWSRVFDGMFFTKTMFPSTKAGDVPAEIKWKRGS